MNSFIYSTRLNIGDIENIEIDVDDKVESENTRRRMQDEMEILPSASQIHPEGGRERQGEAKNRNSPAETRPIRA